MGKVGRGLTGYLIRHLLGNGTHRNAKGSYNNIFP